MNSSLVATDPTEDKSIATESNNSCSVEIERHSRPDVLELHTEHHGDFLRDKREGVIRIGFLNINGLPMRKGTAKYDSLQANIKASELDILGLAETNRRWHSMNPENTYKEVSKEWWKDSKSVKFVKINN